MRNLSIRFKFISLVVLINLIGAVTVGIYLHQTFSSGLSVTADESVRLTKGAVDDITTHSAQKLGYAYLVGEAPGLVERMKKITGSDYGLLLVKDPAEEKAYAAARTLAKQPNNWSEGETYVLAASTDEALGQKMVIKAQPGDVPGSGRAVGIENGACSRQCHGSVKGEGDFWDVSWSTDARSRAHAVVPIMDASGKPIALMYSIRDISAQADSDRTSMLRTLGLIAGGLALGALAVALALDKLVLARLTRMTEAMEDLGMRVAGGDFGATFTPDGTTDEIGEFETFFAKFVNAVTSMLRSTLAKGA